MGRHAKISRQTIADSAVRLVVHEGAPKATIKAISAGISVNEAALYRHYKSKEEILASAYVGIVEEMAREKQHLAKAGLPFRELVHEWIRLTYRYFDTNPDAFAYVFLLPPPSSVVASGITRVQGALFLSLIKRALKSQEIHSIPAKLGYSHFAGIMLNIPRSIREGVLPGPAGRYVDAAVQAVLRVWGVDSNSE